MNVIVAKTAAEESLGVHLPSRRLEEWKWTDLRRLVDKPYAAVSAAPNAKDIDRLIAASPFTGAKLQRLVVVNGVLDEQRSQFKGITIKRTAPALSHDDPLISLNNSLAPTGISISFEGAVDRPLEILNVTVGDGATAAASRLHIFVADDSSATIVETYVGEGSYLHNPVTSLELGRGARLDRVKVETEDTKATHLAHVVSTLAAKANLNDFTFTSGAMLSRQNGDCDFLGEGGNARISGAYLLNNTQHVDTRLVVDHKVPHCMSRELFKCVMADKARGIFQGKVIVRPDAQKTDGKQSSHALLLSETAEFDAKPELEIYADDVVCGHGATCGDLNHDHLFYLRSRGIPENQARALLVHAFVAEAIETVENEAIREALDALASRRMAEFGN